MSKQLVVLGLDGLDVQKTRGWEPDLLLDHHAELDLSGFEMLRTSFIWPTMYAGEHPHERGFEEGGEAEDDHRSSWDNPLIEAASIVGSRIVPRKYRRSIGARLRRGGYDADPLSGHNSPQRDLFEGDCLFSSLKSKVIEVPAWNKGEADIKFNNRGAWSSVLESDGGVEFFFDALEEELEWKRSETLDAIEYPNDLVWTHFHFVDAVQHFFGEDVEREWYGKAADLVADVSDALDDDQYLVVLADHGLGESDHREPGLVCVEDDDLLPLPERPREVRGWLESFMAEQIEVNEETEANLTALGYADFQEE
ncbi:MAG: alkaline phosphatase family protein [Halorientalis sp.]